MRKRKMGNEEKEKIGQRMRRKEKRKDKKRKI